jgi:hypothetical protein
MTYTQPEPSFAQLLDWIEGRLPAEEAAPLATWAAQASDEARAQIAWLQAFVRQSERTVLAAPSDGARAEVLRAFAAHTREQRQPNFIQRLVATLASSGSSRPALAGARGGSTGSGASSNSRQLVYATDLADVVLNIRPRPHNKQFDLSGQVLPMGEALASSPVPLTVQVLQREAEFGITATNALGEFDFAALPAGAYDLVISDSQYEIEVNAVNL